MTATARYRTMPAATHLFSQWVRQMTDSTVESPLFYQTKSYTPTVAKADGIYIWDTTGKKYIDGSSGAVICNIGHNDPSILKAITTQAQSTFFSYRTQFENEPAIDLANTLVAHSADHLEKIFYVSGGSEAVESALKLCRSYYYSRGEANRFMFISRSPSYHGSTMGALSLTSYTPLEQQYRPLLQSFPKIPAPYCYRCHYKQCYPHCGVVCAHELENTLLKIGPENVAGFVTEPIGGASTGAIVPPPAYFSIIRKICDKYGIMLIFDEVMTGFGRTGKLFAYEHWNVKADIVALSKGMASGYYPLGAIMTRNDIVQSVMTYGGFPHGHTYAGNPMACAVGLAVFNRIIESDLPANAEKQGKRLKQGLQALAEKHTIIGEVRGKGLLTALEFVKNRETREAHSSAKGIGSRITAEAFAEGLIVYPRRPINGYAGDHVLIAPPLIVNEQQIDTILEKLDTAISRVMDSIAEKHFNFKI